MLVLIYGLADPRTNVLRYIGQTRDPCKRYWRHCHPASNSRTHRDLWIRALAREGLKPVFVEVERAPTKEQGDDLECFWIASLRAAGAILLNHADGGQGSSNGRRGQKLTPEHRAKISAAHTGLRHSVETREKLSLRRKERKTSDATREKMQRTQRERYRTWSLPTETRERIAEKMRAIWKERRLGAKKTVPAPR